MVYKYGFTGDILRRFAEHNVGYGKHKPVQLYLAQFTLIDVQFVSEAGSGMRQLFNDFGKALPVDGKKELVALNATELRYVKKQFEMLKANFAGSSHGYQEMFDKLKIECANAGLEFAHKQKLVHLEHANELLKKTNDVEMLKKDMDQQHAMLKKDMDQQHALLKKDNETNDLRHRMENDRQTWSSSAKTWSSSAKTWSCCCCGPKCNKDASMV